MKSLLLPILLQILAAGIIIAEVIIPSGGLLAIAAIGLIGYSLYLVYTGVSLSAGYIMTGLDAVLLPVVVLLGLKLLARSPAALRTELSSSAGVTSQSAELETYLGKTGRALTDLRPAGMARIADKRLDVVSRGEYIDKDTEVIVTAVTGNQVMVKKMTADRT